MNKEFPADIEKCIEKGARRFGEALENLHWPNGGKNAPPHEVNALINISHYLGSLAKPYHVYAEATVNERCRVDMLGFDGENAIALEAKGFGDINKKSKEALGDFDRLKKFRPSLTNLAGDKIPPQWWDEAESRWGIIVISSFRGQKVCDAWLAQDEVTLKEKFSNAPIGFVDLHRAVSTLYRRTAFITDATQWGSGEGYLLWAAVQLP